LPPGLPPAPAAAESEPVDPVLAGSASSELELQLAAMMEHRITPHDLPKVAATYLRAAIATDRLIDLTTHITAPLKDSFE